MPHKIQSVREETANTITHGIGFLLALTLVPMLVAKATTNDTLPITIASVVFSFGILMSYLSSTMYHFVQKPQIKKLLRVWDHISIFFLIGGSYTPIICKYTEPHTAAWFLTGMWSLIALGSLLKIFFTGKYDRVSTAVYIILGWMVVLVIKPIMANMPSDIFSWIVAGGCCYTFGVIFYKWQNLTFQHSIWHVFVLAGTLLHFIGIYKCIGV